jgi:hypothetical protein
MASLILISLTLMKAALQIRIRMSLNSDLMQIYVKAKEDMGIFLHKVSHCLQLSDFRWMLLLMNNVPKADFKEQIKKIAEIVPKGGLLFLGMLEGKGEGFFEGPDYPRFFAYYSPKEIIQKVSPYFIKKDYYHVKSGASGYMLFVLERL